MDVWRHVMDFTERNADKVEPSQWNLNYLEVVGTNYESSPKIDDICKRIPKLRIETRTQHVKPQVESKLGLNFKYRPPAKRAWRPLTRRTVSVKVVVPKVEVLPKRNCFCTCSEDFSSGNEARHGSMSLDKLLEIIQRHDRDKIRGDAILSIATAFDSDISIDEDTAIRILMMLDSNINFVQEGVLRVIHRLSKVLVNAKLFLLHGVLDDLIYLMLMGSTEQVQTWAANCIAKLTERDELVGCWSETMVISGTEALFDVLEAEEVTSDDLCYAVLETIANMANNEKLADMLLEFGLERVVRLIRLQSDKENSVVPSKTQGLVVNILTNIVHHDCSKVEQFLDKYSEAVEGVIDVLQYGECQQQQEAARFLATLTVFKPSIDFIISHNATQHLIWAMTCSHCRFVREHSSKAFKNIAFHQDKDKLLNALSQLSSGGSSESVTEMLSEWAKQDEMSAKLVNTVKNQISCSALEKIMVEVFAVICVSFQTDSLHLSGQESDFNVSDNCFSNSYLSSLRVLRNTMAAIEKLICLSDADSEETGVNLKLASLYVQCGGLQFIEQLAFLSTKLKTVNPPNYHSIDLSNLPPKELLSTMKTTRKELMFQQNKSQSKTIQNASYGLHSHEVEFFEQLLVLLTVLGRAIAPDYDPAIEDLKVFSYRRKFVGKKKHISFRTRALMVRSTLKKTKSSPEIDVSGGEEKSIGAVSSKRRSSATAVRKNGNRSTSTISTTRASAHSKKDEAILPSPVIDPGTSSNDEIVHYLKLSMLNSKVISHLACWITCGNYDIQMKVLTVLRYLMHVGQAQQTDTQDSCKEPKEAWATKTPSTNPTGLRSSVGSTVSKSKRKLSYLGHLCVRHVIQYCGPYLLDLLSPSSKGGLGRMSLMVIHECIVNGELESRIALVKLGSFAQIIEYIRGTEDKADIQALCLVVLRKLVSSDQSLKQLFFAHGGMSLVMALHEYKHGVVKEQAAFALAALSKGSTLVTKSKVVSKKRHKKSLSSDDIWDHVTHKWEGQDKVSKLLKKFNVRY